MEKDVKALIEHYKDRGLYNPSLNYAKGIEDYEQAVKDKDNEKIKAILIAYGGIIGLTGGASIQKLDNQNN